jgi:transcription initiation factor TFIIH subunit 4
MSLVNVGGSAVPSSSSQGSVIGVVGPPPSSIYAYLLTISAEDLEDLYRTPYCALAVLQSLSSLSRVIVVRLLSLRGAVTEDFLRAWLRPGTAGDARCAAVLNELRALHLLCPPQDHRALGSLGVVSVNDRGVVAWILSPIFRNALAEALTGGADAPWAAESIALKPLAKPLSVPDVEHLALGRWNAVLHYLLGTADAPLPEPKVAELLVSTGLLEPGPDPEAGVAGAAAMGRALAGDALAGSGGSGGGGGGGSGGDDKGIDKRPLTFAEIYQVGGGETHITREGYDFLLKDTGVQLWTFLHEYIRTANARGMRATDILAGLFQLGFCRLGEGYAINALTRSQLALFEDFAAFGLVVIPPIGATSRRPDRFYPSSLAILLSQPEENKGGGGGNIKKALQVGSSSTIDSSLFLEGEEEDDDEDEGMSAAFRITKEGGGLAGQGQGHGFRGGTIAPMVASAAFSAAAAAASRETRLALVVETNFKLYAYPAPSLGLHVALLALFARVELRLPNLIVASLTRKSVLSAMARGISANAIASFLTSRLLPQQAAEGVPENVVAQMVLWEQERERVVARKAILVGPLSSESEWNTATRAAVNVAGGEKAILWQDAKRRTLVVAKFAAHAVELALKGGGAKK